MTAERVTRAAAIARAGGFEAALERGDLPRRADVTMAEAVVLGLLRQGVTRFVVVLGHGSTELGEVLRVYQDAGVLRTFAVRHETEASHAATALRWVTGEGVAVVTSIGPGALQAMAGSLVAASDGVGVWHIYGDETTEDEGPNMQQIPRAEQGLFLRLTATMGPSYSLHTPRALPTALRRGLNQVDHPYRPGPFFLLLPLNTQPELIKDFNLDELPVGAPPRLGKANPTTSYAEIARRLLDARRVVIKVGGGATECRAELEELADLVDGVFVMSPISLGIIPSGHPRQMMVGGSKGSLSGNHAMENADLLLAVGTRSVCQADSSRTGYPNVRHVVNINADLDAATHYARTSALVGDARLSLAALIEAVRAEAAEGARQESEWLAECQAARAAWEDLKAARLARPRLHDPVWGREVLTQPAAVHTVAEWAAETRAVTFFDAGDVQAYGFQMSAQDEPGASFTEAGASYMGFATSAVLATAMSDRDWYAVAVTGDGSFTMNPQVLIDGVAHGATGCVVVLDNRRMAAISSLQIAQYGKDHATWDHVAVDYVAWGASVNGVNALFGGTTPEELRAALDKARAHSGLSIIHVPVYFGPDPDGGLPSYGRWNVGNWVGDTQELRHEIGL
ncbi:thiamine pyrophosphate-binding protein [Microtetraspora malaysiensis]|uniref:thiamine pyrophosphate-binding protein n=1 Tax=Microtetraspora malaysiensis TaxID=161358 RepID=UPI00082F0C63|nr:thiamine pyrophosphate-dependent enzyme [Microtetraspora malaysiensis]